MNYKVVTDSCCEWTDEMKKSGVYENAPLTIQVDDKYIVDDETFDQADFLRMVAESPNCPKSSCPSPELYMQEFGGETERAYAVTLSSQLSGSYNSAVLGRNLYVEECGEKNIHVFDSRSASIAETLIAMDIRKYEEQGLAFEKIVENVEADRDERNTYFVLESLDALRKNGRLTGIKAVVASALNIKPVMGATKEGTIIQLGQARGIKKALAKMVDHIVNDAKDTEGKILAISHCNCLERAKMVESMIRERIQVKSSFILDTEGISSLYASDGGIIVVL